MSTLAERRETAIKEARKALTCLYIAVDKHVADDVNAKILPLLLALEDEGAKEPVGYVEPKSLDSLSICSTVTHMPTAPTPNDIHTVPLYTRPPSEEEAL